MANGTTAITTDELDYVDRITAPVVPDENDDDGHFPGITDARVKEIVAKLNHVGTRQWTYVKDAVLPARLVKAPKAKKDPHAPLDRRLTDAEQRVLLALVTSADKDLSNSYWGLERVATTYGFHPRVLKRLICSLVKKGWINRTVRSPYSTLVNQFCVPPGVLASWHEGWTCPVVLTRKRREGE